MSELLQVNLLRINIANRNNQTNIHSRIFGFLYRKFNPIPISRPIHWGSKLKVLAT